MHNRVWRHIVLTFPWSVCRSVCNDEVPCKNGWTDRDAVWHVGLGGVGHSHHVLDGGPDPPRGRAIMGWGEGRPIVKYMDNGP